MTSSDDIREIVRERSDIVDIVQRTVPLRRYGRSWKACCPFHDEKTPSFTVSEERQTFYCFGCGAKGDVFSFVMQRDNVEFKEALAWLAEQAGIELRPTSGPRDDDAAPRRLRAALEFATGRFRKLLDSPTGAPARRYLEERRLTPDTWETFRLGFSADVSDGLVRAALAEGFSARTLELAGLALPTQSGRLVDRFQGRLMIPISDGLGRAVGFGARLLPEVLAARPEGRGTPQGKYINSPDTPLFHKGELVYALDHVLRTKTTLPVGKESERWLALVEGYTDVMAAHQSGIPWVGAVLGTALTSEHARLLRRHVDGLVLVYDGDDAGVNAALKSLPILLEQQLDLRVLVLPDRQDPCDYLNTHGNEAFLDLVRRAPDHLDFALAMAMQRFGNEPSRLARALDWILAMLQGVSEVERETAYPRIADRLRLREETVRLRAREKGLAPAATEDSGFRPENGSWGKKGKHPRWRDRSRFAGPDPALQSRGQGAMAQERAQLRELLATLVLMPSLAPAVRRLVDPAQMAVSFPESAREEVELYRRALEAYEQRGEILPADLSSDGGAAWLHRMTIDRGELSLQEAKITVEEIATKLQQCRDRMELENERARLLRAETDGRWDEVRQVQVEIRRRLRKLKGWPVEDS
ncbi:MAG: DNA primase [Planctomycetes bacterium]|nr:DNA primase [Planctomycetota bacterium]